ncbi:MAG: helix-turn-helix domain-containing protein, partial [Clostridia bacterium]|nr:helix-turn-helix domain-containing protein [Clostridia bacterium]
RRKITLKTNGDNLQPDADFKRGTGPGVNGEGLCVRPVELKDEDDLRNDGITWEDRETMRFGKGGDPTVISWDGLLEQGYEPVPGAPADEQVYARLEYEAIRKRMDAEDPRIAVALEAKVLEGWSVKEIAERLGVSVSRAYRLIDRARAIGKQYREENPYD